MGFEKRFKKSAVVAAFCQMFCFGFAHAGTFVAKGSVVPGSADVHKYVLANGLRVLLLQDNRNLVATVRIRLDAGSNREVLGKTGLAHFFEHMMFRKTRFSEEGQYDRTLAGVGGNGNAGTSTDYVVFYSKFPAPALETVLEIESQRMTGVELKEPFFSTEKGAVISERGINVDNVPMSRGSEVIRTFVEQGTPYEWPTLGSKKDVEGMKIEDVQKFFSDFYTPDNAIVSVGGPLEIKTMLAMVEKAFGGWKGSRITTRGKFPADYLSRNNGKYFVCGEDVAEQTYSVVYPSFASTVEDVWYSMAMQDAMEDNLQGTFERRLQKSKMATGFGFYKEWWQRPNPHAVAVFTLSPEQKFEDVLAAWNKEVHSVLQKPVDKHFRNRLVKQIEVSKAEAALRMTSLIEMHENNEFFNNDFLSTLNMEKFFASLNQQKFRAWIEKNIVHASYYVTAIVPKNIAPTCSEKSFVSVRKGM